MSDPCPYCGTEMRNTGSPIWEDYCPNKKCHGHADEFRASLARTVEAMQKAERVRSAAPDLLESARPFEEIIQEGSEDLPDDTPVVVKIGERVLDMTLTLENFRALQRAVLKAEASS